MRNYNYTNPFRGNRKNFEIKSLSPKPLDAGFFSKKTLWVARNLLGKVLVRKQGKKIHAGIITETEAYSGPKDLASHASRGRTPRTEMMFGAPGRAYVYLVYGMHYCFNIVTEKKDYPAAVLIRAIQVWGVDYKKTNGPGKLCRLLYIDKTLNGNNITKRETLWVEDRNITVLPSQIQKTPRIGVEYAKEYKKKKWRYVVKMKNVKIKMTDKNVKF